MSATKRLQWHVDATEFERFRSFVEEKHGVIDLCLPSEVIQAMRAYLDKDRVSEIETDFDWLDEVLADSFEGYRRRRSSSGKSADPLVRDDFGSDERRKVRCKVPADLRDEFTAYVDEHTDWNYGEALSRAMNAYRTGSRIRRLREVIEDLGGFIQELSPRSLSETEETEDESSNPYSIEDKLRCIREDIAEANDVESADEAGDVFRSVLEESIHRWCAKGDRDEVCGKTLRTWIDRVCDDLDLYESENGKLFIKDTGDEDASDFETKPYDALSADEKVKRVRLELIRKAVNNGGRAQLSARDIEDEVFDGEAGTDSGDDLRKRAAKDDGFHLGTGRGNIEMVKVDIDEVTDDDLLVRAGVKTEEEDEEEAIREDVQEQWSMYDDAEMEKSVATDGGSDHPE